jgi:hypothetical protein
MTSMAVTNRWAYFDTHGQRCDRNKGKKGFVNREKKSKRVGSLAAPKQVSVVQLSASFMFHVRVSMSFFISRSAGCIKMCATFSDCIKKAHVKSQIIKMRLIKVGDR